MLSRLSALYVGLTTVACVAGAVSARVRASTADPPGSSSSDLNETQARLDAAAPAVQAAGADDPSFLSISINAETSTIEVWREGSESQTPPAEIDALYRAACPVDVNISYRSSPLTANQVEQLNAIVRVESRNLRSEGVSIHGFGQMSLDGPFTILYDTTTPERALPEFFIEHLNRIAPNHVLFTRSITRGAASGRT